jgi:hypothetical protein
VSTVDGNRNPVRTDFSLIGVNTPSGLRAPVPISPPVELPSEPPPSSESPTLPASPVAPAQPTASPTGWAVSLDSGAFTSQVFVFRPDGSLAMSVTPFGNTYRGGVRIARGDINGDGLADLITATGPGVFSRVRVWDAATAAMIVDIDPFPGYRGGLWVAAGDMNGDGAADFAVGADLGMSPHVKVFNGRGMGELASFYAYAPGFVGGVRVAMGDINRDGFADLVTGPGAGAGPHVAMFDGRSIAMGLGPQRVANDFFIYAPTMTLGLNLAVGDMDGDGYADIIAGPANGVAHLRVVSGQALSSGQGPVDLASMFTWDTNFTGLRLAATDADGDGRTDIMAATGGPNRGRVAMLGSTAVLSYNPDAAFWFDPLPGLPISVFVG